MRCVSVTREGGYGGSVTGVGVTRGGPSSGEGCTLLCEHAQRGTGTTARDEE